MNSKLILKLLIPIIFVFSLASCTDEVNMLQMPTPPEPPHCVESISPGQITIDDEGMVTGV